MQKRTLAALLLILFLASCSGVDLVNLLAQAEGPIERNIAFGELERQKLDIYHPEQLSNKTPVLLYFHGGSWKDGSKNDYKFLGSAYAARGFQTVVANYRLYPEVTHPDFVHDSAKAIAYTKSEIAKDRPLYVMGHSAGAHISALALADEKYLANENTNTCATVAGYIGVAGPYDFVFTEDIFKRIFPETPRIDAKPVTHAGNQALPPFLLLHGTNDETVPFFRSEQMRDALIEAGNPVQLKAYESVGHIDILGAVAPLIRGRAPTFEDTISFMQTDPAELGSPC